MSALIGQRNAETRLARAVAHGRVGHAYLFLGAAGCGKSTAARLFARAMNCERQPAARQVEHGWELAPCETCQSCRRIAADTHPEVLEIRPDSKTGQNITVDQARQIRRNAALRPKLGARRIYIIANAEAFNEESGNALLKTLEEPSEFVTLILCAPSASQVLPTIRSRCQVVRFGLAGPEEVSAALRERGSEADTALALARACGGRPGLAISWIHTPEVLQRRRQVLHLFARAVQAQERANRDPGTGVLSLRLAEELRGLVSAEKDDESPKTPAKVLHSDNLETGLTYLRDLLLLTSGADPDLVHNHDRISELLELASVATPGRVMADMDTVRQSQKLLDRNVTPALVLERMFWAVICGALPVSEPLFEEAYS